MYSTLKCASKLNLSKIVYWDIAYPEFSRNSYYLSECKIRRHHATPSLSREVLGARWNNPV